MKKQLLLTLLTLTLSIPLFAQIKQDSIKMPTNKAGAVEFAEVLDLKGRTKNELFNNAIQFVAENYKNPNVVTKLSDRIAGKLIVSTFFILQERFHINSTLQIDIKDGKYRYVYRDFTYQVVIESLTGDLAPKVKIFDPVFPNENYSNPEVSDWLANGTINKINGLIKNLKDTMIKKDDF